MGLIFSTLKQEMRKVFKKNNLFLQWSSLGILGCNIGKWSMSGAQNWCQYKTSRVDSGPGNTLVHPGAPWKGQILPVFSPFYWSDPAEFKTVY